MPSKIDAPDSWGPPLAAGEVEQLKEFFSQPRERLAVIVDDLEAEERMYPDERAKIRAHYGDIFRAFQLPEGVLCSGGTTRSNAKAAFQLFRCGPSTSPCGPNRDDHAWDDEVEFTDGAGKNCGGSVACSRCGMTAMDYDIWTAP